jgi:hypothetical protein
MSPRSTILTGEDFMAEDIKVVCKHQGGGGLASLWIIGWLFTIGFLKLAFWKGVLAVIVWPYYLGVFFQPKPGP